MHSSRMRTGRSLTACRSLLPVGGGGGGVRGGSARGSLLPGGCVCSRGGLLPGGGVCSGEVSAPGGSAPGGGYPSMH